MNYTTRRGKRATSSRSLPVQVEMTSQRPVTMPGSVSLSDRQPPPGHGHRGAAVSAVTGETTTTTTAMMMMMSASGSMVLPAGIINPSVPIRNIKMKFAVLIGLIQVGEVSNRDIVETVLNLVSKCFFFLLLSLYDWMLVLNPESGVFFSGKKNNYYVDTWPWQ